MNEKEKRQLENLRKVAFTQGLILMATLTMTIILTIKNMT